MKKIILLSLILVSPAFAGPPKLDPSILSDANNFDGLIQTLTNSQIQCICSTNISPSMPGVEVTMPSDVSDPVAVCNSYESRYFPVHSSRDRAPSAYAALLKCEPRAVTTTYTNAESTSDATATQTIARQMDAFQRWSVDVGGNLDSVKSDLSRLQDKLDDVMRELELQAVSSWSRDVSAKAPPEPPQKIYIPPTPVYQPSAPTPQPGTSWQTRERDGGKGGH